MYAIDTEGLKTLKIQIHCCVWYPHEELWHFPVKSEKIGWVCLTWLNFQSHFSAYLSSFSWQITLWIFVDFLLQNLDIFPFFFVCVFHPKLIRFDLTFDCGCGLFLVVSLCTSVCALTACACASNTPQCSELLFKK